MQMENAGIVNWKYNAAADCRVFLSSNGSEPMLYPAAMIGQTDGWYLYRADFDNLNASSEYYYEISCESNFGEYTSSGYTLPRIEGNTQDENTSSSNSNTQNVENSVDSFIEVLDSSTNTDYAITVDWGYNVDSMCYLLVSDAMDMAYYTEYAGQTQFTPSTSQYGLYQDTATTGSLSASSTYYYQILCQPMNGGSGFATDVMSITTLSAPTSSEDENTSSSNTNTYFENGLYVEVINQSVNEDYQAQIEWVYNVDSMCYLLLSEYPSMIGYIEYSGTQSKTPSTSSMGVYHDKVTTQSLQDGQTYYYKLNCQPKNGSTGVASDVYEISTPELPSTTPDAEVGPTTSNSSSSNEIINGEINSDSGFYYEDTNSDLFIEATKIYTDETNKGIFQWKSNINNTCYAEYSRNSDFSFNGGAFVQKQTAIQYQTPNPSNDYLYGYEVRTPELLYGWNYYVTFTCLTSTGTTVKSSQYSFISKDVNSSTPLGYFISNENNNAVRPDLNAIVEFGLDQDATCSVQYNDKNQFTDSTPSVNAEYTQIASSKNDGWTYYRALLPGLKTNTQYYYRLQCETELNKYNIGPFKLLAYEVSASDAVYTPPVTEKVSELNTSPRTNPSIAPVNAISQPTTTASPTESIATTPVTEPVSIAPNIQSDIEIAEKWGGKLFLQVEDRGRIWYVNPDDGLRYEVTFENALPLFQKMSLGISTENLNKIPLSPMNFSDDFDTDNDGYTDKSEVANGYNPYGSGKMEVDEELANRLKGELLLQTDQGGRIWYVDFDGYRHEVTWGNLMPLFENLSTGITNANLETARIGQL